MDVTANEQILAFFVFGLNEFENEVENRREKKSTCVLTLVYVLITIKMVVVNATSSL